MTVAYVTHKDCLLHEMGVGHPESPARLSAIQDRLTADGRFALVCLVEAPFATNEQLSRVHDPAYVERIMRIAPKEGVVRLDPDTVMNPHSLNAALRAAGALVHAVDLVVRGEVTTAFCAVRPPGHHAERSQAMGFCFFNNVAVGAAHALAMPGISRVVIVDFDVHHGNGTEDIFRNEPRVLFCSSFQHPFYPGSGAYTHSHHIINMPLPAGTTGVEFREQVEARWLPALDRFRPQFVFISAGFDAHAADPLAQLLFTEEDYTWITQQMVVIAKQHAQGRLVSTLEGGYDLPALGHSAAAHIKALME
ncbi:MAG: histone deacetylase family protein [Gammaproteobacteria bacterium]